MALGEVALMSTSSTLAEMMHPVTMIVPWWGEYFWREDLFAIKLCTAVYNSLYFRLLLIVIGNEESDGSAAVSATGIRSENAGGPDPENVVDEPVPVSERGREKDRLEA